MSDHVCKREIVISKALHILTINCVINLPTVSSVYSEVYCRSGRGAERAENQVEWSGAVSRSCRKTMERSGERGLITEIGWSAFFAAHAPLTCSGAWPEQTLDSLVRFGPMWSDAVISHTALSEVGSYKMQK